MNLLKQFIIDTFTKSKPKNLSVKLNMQFEQFYVLEVKNIKIINIANLIGEAIRNISQEKSVSTLFD